MRKRKRRPPVSKSTHFVDEPKHSREELLKFLGVDPDMVQRAKEQKHELTDEMWATMEMDTEWDEEPE